MKLACFVLAAGLLYQLVQTARRVNPLAKVVIPALPRLAGDTNALAVGASASGPARGTNVVGVAAALVVATNRPHGTNVTHTPHATHTNLPSTNALAKLSTTNARPAMPTMNMASMSRGGVSSGGGRPAELAPEIKARVDRIYESELFGMVMRPQPMALQGIMGNSAILRSPSGQTGLVKEGDSLGELKLLRIGINRVLVEQDGKKSELMIFEGYGGESLMPKEKENSK